MSGLRRYLRAMWRASLTAESWLTAKEAAEACPGRPQAARAWLAEHVEPAGEVAGEAVYRWGDVVVAIAGMRQAGTEWATSAEVGRRPIPDSDEPSARARGERWWRHREVQRHLGVDARTLKARMSETPEHISSPWCNVGSARKPAYHWRGEGVDQWWMEVNRWRASTNGTGATGSDGATRMGAPGRAPVQTARRRSGSSARSRSASPPAGAGNLVTLVQNLLSEK